MSIYATLGSVSVPDSDNFFNDPKKGWVVVWFQGVPGHIGHPEEGYTKGDPYSDFLPPVVDYPRKDLRAVVVLRDDLMEKDGQRYISPLFTITGDEWKSIPFPEMLERIERSLNINQPDMMFCRGNDPPVPIRFASKEENIL